VSQTASRQSSQFPPYSQRRSAPRPLFGRIREVDEARDGLLDNVPSGIRNDTDPSPHRLRYKIRKEKLPDLQGLGWVREKRAIISEGTTMSPSQNRTYRINRGRGLLERSQLLSETRTRFLPRCAPALPDRVHPRDIRLKVGARPRALGGQILHDQMTDHATL
jgi:hypothetical protein